MLTLQAALRNDAPPSKAKPACCFAGIRLSQYQPVRLHLERPNVNLETVAVFSQWHNIPIIFQYVGLYNLGQVPKRAHRPDAASSQAVKNPHNHRLLTLGSRRQVANADISVVLTPLDGVQHEVLVAGQGQNLRGELGKHRVGTGSDHA
ncbi:hypothetical protein PoMZ_07871 [Pyricularia oryzae]|uniref:Uncharacterized protein n=1 Tax=Pyricularia oryzae TaxID=318829 RepID=A0A4P7NG76_PYROR|nr:hypothetical protein PoMZ_07871 [Pyricularia oryzae]